MVKYSPIPNRIKNRICKVRIFDIPLAKNCPSVFQWMWLSGCCCHRACSRASIPKPRGAQSSDRILPSLDSLQHFHIIPLGLTKAKYLEWLDGWRQFLAERLWWPGTLHPIATSGAVSFHLRSSAGLDFHTSQAFLPAGRVMGNNDRPALNSSWPRSVDHSIFGVPEGPLAWFFFC